MTMYCQVSYSTLRRLFCLLVQYLVLMGMLVLCRNVMASKTLPRGIRNCNPLNLRIGNDWQGEVKKPNDAYFEQFTEMRWGIRAACIVLRRYIDRYHRRTIPEIVESWAPPHENFTKAYALAVSRHSEIPMTETIDYQDRAQFCRLLDAMAWVECGETVPMADIESGYDLAFNSITT